MLRFISKSLILFVLLASLSGAAFLGRAANAGSRPEAMAGAMNLAGPSGLPQYTAGGHVLGFRKDGVVIASRSHALKVEFVDARPVSPVEEGKPSESVKDRRAGQPLGRVTYHDLWDGVTVVYEKTESGVVESSYHIQPGEAKASNPVDKIRLRYNVPVRVDGSGNLVISFATGEMRETRPVAWQDVSRKKVAVEAEYRLLGEQEVGFKVGAYDPRYALVIDPVLSWNTFLGGSGWDQGMGIAVDTNGNVYVTGSSQTSWGLSPVRAYSGGNDAFVAKVGKNGALQWNTFLGQAGGDQGSGIAVDASGNVYVTGLSNGPWESKPIDAYAGGGFDAFVAKLDANGILQWYTFLGGTGIDFGQGIALDASGNSYVTGYSDASWGSPLNDYAGGYDAFVAKLDANGARGWNTFLGQAGGDQGSGIAMDTSGNSYVTGYSDATWGSPLLTFAGGQDAFVAKLDVSGVLQWNLFLGGANDDQGNGLAVDASGNVYVTGMSKAVWGSPVRAYTGGQDAFVAKLDANGALQWNTFLGGSSGDYGFGIAVDTSGNSYVTGETYYATWGSPVRAYTAGYDSFAAKLDANGALRWNTFLGGSGWDHGQGIAVDTSGNSYVTGYSDATWGSPLLPYAGSADAFVAKIGNVKVDFNRDGQEDILWRYYGSGVPQGWDVAWLMHQSTALSPAALGIQQTNTGGIDFLMGSSPKRAYTTPMDVGNSRATLPAQLSKTPMGVGKVLTPRPKKIARNPFEYIPNLGRGDKGQAREKDVKGMTALRDPAEIRTRGSIPLNLAPLASSALSSGTTKIASLDYTLAFLTSVLDTDWELVGTGDFNGDGNTDTLWRYNGSGYYQGWNVIWYMNGETITSYGFLPTVWDTNWKIAGTGDFNGDGKLEILWRYYGTGDIQGWNVIWYLNGETIASYGFPPVVSDLNWKIDGVGDFDGDGKADIFWRYYGAGGFQGLNVICYMNGTTIASYGFPTPVTKLGWRVDGVGDFDGDGKADLLWRYYDSGYHQGLNVVWYMDGAAVKSQEYLTIVYDTNWRIVNR
jgi:hypothetical protein